MNGKNGSEVFEDLKKIIRSIIECNGNEMSLMSLQTQFKDINGYCLPYKRFNCRSELELIQRMDDSFGIEMRDKRKRKKFDCIVYCLTNERTRHLVEMIRHQKTSAMIGSKPKTQTGVGTDSRADSQWNARQSRRRTQTTVVSNSIKSQSVVKKRSINSKTKDSLKEVPELSQSETNLIIQRLKTILLSNKSKNLWLDSHIKDEFLRLFRQQLPKNWINVVKESDLFEVQVQQYSKVSLTLIGLSLSPRLRRQLPEETVTKPSNNTTVVKSPDPKPELSVKDTTPLTSPLKLSEISAQFRNFALAQEMFYSINSVHKTNTTSITTTETKVFDNYDDCIQTSQSNEDFSQMMNNESNSVSSISKLENYFLNAFNGLNRMECLNFEQWFSRFESNFHSLVINDIKDENAFNRLLVEFYGLPNGLDSKKFCFSQWLAACEDLMAINNVQQSIPMRSIGVQTDLSGDIAFEALYL